MFDFGRVTLDPPLTYFGRVVDVRGMLVEAEGLASFMAVGDQCHVAGEQGEMLAEAIAIRHQRVLLMLYGDPVGLRYGTVVRYLRERPTVLPHEQWLGRVINSQGIPMDGRGDLPLGLKEYRLKALPLPAHRRRRVQHPMETGVAAIDSLCTVCVGQRMGIFAASGVGKSVLLGMMARFSEADVKVIGLIGERGREVQEFLESTLGEEGLAQSVVIVSTSDEPALSRRRAAYMTLAVAEFFRDQGKHVLCMLDSVTRFAMSLRDIGLTAGEPPTTKGYTPSVFAELPMLLERLGPGASTMGDITGLITVLVDGDDHDEPIADAVRGILDGHCVMDRKIAERGRYPAINVLRSLSRMVPQCLTPWEQRVAREVRKRLADYEDMAELIRIGAYQPGSDPAVDLARVEVPKIEALLTQMPESKVKRSDAYRALAEIVGIEIVGVENDDEAASGAIVEAERRTLIGSAASGDA